MGDKIEKTIDAYNKNSRAYTDKFMNFELYEKRVKEFTAFLEPGAKVLDLGCGPGNVARLLSSSGKDFLITGVDLSREMVKLARKNVPTGMFHCEDIRKINFPEETFDAIILSFCIIHLSDAEMKTLLGKVSKYLKAEGKLYLSFMEGEGAGLETTSFSEEEIYFNYYSADDVLDLLHSYNLNEFKLYKQDYPEDDGTVTTDVFIFAEKNC